MLEIPPAGIQKAAGKLFAVFNNCCTQYPVFHIKQHLAYVILIAFAFQILISLLPIVGVEMLSPDSGFPDHVCLLY